MSENIFLDLLMVKDAFRYLSLNDLIEKVIPHFDQYPMLSAKQQDFESFKEVCLLMKKGEHLTLKGMKKILPIAFKMNESGKRRYSQKDILAFMNAKLKV